MEEAAEALETKLNLNCLNILKKVYTKQVFLKQIIYIVDNQTINFINISINYQK